MTEQKKTGRGGARPGSGPKPKLGDERTIKIRFSVKKKHADEVKLIVRGIVDAYNNTP